MTGPAMTTIRPALASILCSLALLTQAQPLLLEPIDTLLPASDFALSYESRQLSIATDINDQGYVLGYQLTADSQFRTYNIALQTNPAATVIDTPDFLGLSAGPQHCVWIICTGDLAFGIQIGDTSAGTNFVGGTANTNLVPGTLPVSFFPGDFVEENGAGIVISTQQGDGVQFGVIIDGESLTTLADIPWLVDINDNAPAQVLAYDGSLGGCLVTGIGCPDDEDDSAHCDEDRHRHQTGIGHHSHGRGHGYGHHCDSSASAAASARAAAGGALMLTLAATGPTRLRFPDALSSGEGVSALFPLAINNDRAVLRGTITQGDTIWPERLLSCQFDSATLDGNEDGTVDCIGGLLAVEALPSGTRVGTVLGFSLGQDATLVGNIGFTGAGIGIPAVWPLSALPTAPDLLVNRLSAHGNHELSVVTASNNNGQGVGYGYAGCGAAADAYRFSPTDGDLSDLGFSINDLYATAWAAPGQNYSVAPAAHGGSGEYLYRYWAMSPGDDGWALAQDWSDSALAQTASVSEGEICYRIELADANNMADQRLQVLRFRIADAPLSDGNTPALPPASPGAGLEAALEEALPIGSSSLCLLLAMLLAYRRQHQAA